MTSLSILESYGTKFQQKIISALLTKKEFLQNINDIINPEDFNSSSHKWIIEQTLHYYNEYHTVPTLEVLKSEFKKVENEVLQLSIKEQLREIYSLSDSSDLEYIEKEYLNFCKNQQLKKALLSSVDLLKDGEYDSIRHLIDNALKSGQDKNIGHEYNKDTESRYREDARTPISTPWEIINELLQGGLGEGDFGLIFGGPGGGKSWCLVALGAYAIKMGYNVVHYTLELSESYLGRRYDAYYTNIPVNLITKNKEKVQDSIKNLPGKLIIKEFPMGKTSISSIESHIKKCKDLELKPDLIIIDYVDLLSSRKTRGDKKEEIDDIYTSTKGLARELKLPIWSVSQVNRAGARDSIVEGDKAAGSYAKMAIADFAMSLSRQKEDKVEGTGRFHIMKNRYGGDGMTYNASIDTSTGHMTLDDEITGEESANITKKQKQDEQGFTGFDKEYLQKQFFELEN